MKTKKTWYQVKAPNRWTPKRDEELIGVYVGTETREGQFGIYKVHFIRSGKKTHYVSGSISNDLFALVETGAKVKVAFRGMKKCADGIREYKVFELFTQEQVHFEASE